MTGSLSFRRGALVAVLAAGLSATPAFAVPGPFLIRDGVSQPIFSYQNAIRETVWVNTGSDLDRDGHPDRAAVDVIRPSEPAARGQRVPVIMDESTYFTCCGRGNENQKKTYAPDGTPTGFPLFYDNYFVPRGYAVALVDAPGSSRSTGCGINLSEVDAGRRVIDWLNGRAAGYTSSFGDDRAYADWSSGAVGMIGKSYDGLLATGVGVTGVPGLRTIVPIEADSNLYDFFNEGGTSALAGVPWPGGVGTDNERASVLCDSVERQQYAAKQDGDFTPFWQQFDFNRSVNRMRASVLTTQGFQDENIPPIEFGLWWQALTVNHVPRTAWLSQAGHTDPFDLNRAAWVTTLHRWFDRWLLGVPNGIDHEPMITIEHTPDQWVTERQWPPPGTHDQTLHPVAGTLTAVRPARPGSASFVDSSDPGSNRFDWPVRPAGDHLVFMTAPLTHDVRVAGTASMTVRVRSSGPTATITGELVDYGPATVRNAAGPNDATGIRDLPARSCWGESSATDSACYLDTAADLVSVDHQLIGLGYADVGHYAGPYHQLPLDPNTYYTREVNLSTMDHIVPAGHRIGLVVAGTDNWWFGIPGAGARLDVDLAGTTVTLPIAPG
jgi:X-Pro dipeptidyl-peptidase